MDLRHLVMQRGRGRLHGLVVEPAPDREAVAGVGGRGKRDRPFRSFDAGRHVAGDADRGGQRRGGPSLPAAQQGDFCVDTAVAHVSETADRVGLAQEPPGERERVDAHVEKGAASLLVAPEPVVGVGRHGEREVGADPTNLADVARLDPGQRLHVGGVEPHPHRFHEEAAVGFGGGDHPIGLRRVERDRFLDQHMLARAVKHHGLGHVDGVDAGHIHDVDVGIGGELLVAGVSPADPMGRGEALGGFAGAGPDGDDLAPFGVDERVGEARRDGAGAGDAPADGPLVWLHWRLPASRRGSGHHTHMSEPPSFPRRQAVTRRFTLGAPRDFAVADRGARVAFLRSGGPEDPVNALWVFDVDAGAERLVVDPASIDADDADLPPEERARRERARESGGGIVAFDADPELTQAVFAIGGQIARVDLDTGDVTVLPTVAGGFDPRLSPDGRAVAYVAGDELRVVDDGGDRLVVGEEGETVSWGAAEFVAGEEMGRTRGFWWAPDSERILVERVDVAPIDQWWISAPVSPGVAPTAVRYPAAGTANAMVDLAVIGLDGGRVDIDWSDGGWEYLAAASWTDEGLILTVQTRDQRTLAVLDADPETGRAVERHRVVDDAWVELVPGAPRLHRGRLLTVEDREPARRLCVDGEALTGDGVQVRRVISAGDDGIVIAASREPTSVNIATVGWDGDLQWWDTNPGVVAAVVGGDTSVVVSRSLMHDGARAEVQRSRATVAVIEDHAERPAMELNVRLFRLGERELSAALVLPPDVADDAHLPVLVDPYGGPHAQRVQQARSLFHASQWFADVGFAVLITDGRGTPGRGPAFEREVRGDLAGPVLQDQIDALRAMAELEPRLDLGRVAIRGWSFGGYLAALAVMRRPDVFHAAVAGAPVTEWRLYDTHYTERYLGHPDLDPDAYDRSSLLGIPAELEPGVALPPLLLIHGLADDNVVAAHTLQLSRALLEAGRPHTVLPLSGVTHMTPQEEVAENLLLVQLAFLRDALSL